MSQILFEDARPAVQIDLGRSDVACFVGLARRSGVVIPSAVRAWLQTQGLLRFPFAPAPGMVMPPLPAAVRAWFLTEPWIASLVSTAAAPGASLAAAVDAAQTSIAVGSPFSQTPATIVIDTEVLAVAAVDATGRNLTVRRAQSGTIAAPHALGAAVFSAVLGNLNADLTADAQGLTLAAALVADPPLYARIGSEIVAIAQVDATGTLLTVSRGAGGTRAVAHAKNDPVAAVALDPFAQLAGQLASTIPPALQQWLQSAGWLSGRAARDLDRLGDVPVPVENYAAFTALFDAGTSAQSSGTDYLAAALRSFFSQGGRRAYVVRMGDPIAPTDGPADIDAKLAALLVDGSHDAADPRSWHGAGHLAGLADVSFLALPDLPVLCATAPPAGAELEVQTLLGPVQFAECSQQEPLPQQFRTYPAGPPKLAPDDYARWAASVANVLQYLSSGALRGELHLREIQLVAAFPLPQDPALSLDAQGDASAALARDVHDIVAAFLPERAEPLGGIENGNLSSAFLQLAYPWLKTTGSVALQGSLEPPDGALTGVLARTALKFGTYVSATKTTPADISDLWPSLPPGDLRVAATSSWDGSTQKPLVERLSLFGFAPSGIRLLSDVTAYPGEAYRAAGVNRLVAVICRAARRFGETIVFQSNGPALWGRVQAFMRNVMTQLWAAKALDGATVKDAFTVRCDSSTITQNALDGGMVVAEISFTAVAKVELIRVSLAFDAGTTSTQEIAAVLAGAG